MADSIAMEVTVYEDDHLTDLDLHTTIRDYLPAADSRFRPSKVCHTVASKRAKSPPTVGRYPRFMKVSVSIICRPCALPHPLFAMKIKHM